MSSELTMSKAFQKRQSARYFKKNLGKKEFVACQARSPKNVNLKEFRRQENSAPFNKLVSQEIKHKHKLNNAKQEKRGQQSDSLSLFQQQEIENPEPSLLKAEDNVKNASRLNVVKSESRPPSKCMQLIGEYERSRNIDHQVYINLDVENCFLGDKKKQQIEIEQMLYKYKQLEQKFRVVAKQATDCFKKSEAQKFRLGALKKQHFEDQTWLETLNLKYLSEGGCMLQSKEKVTLPQQSGLSSAPKAVQTEISIEIQTADEEFHEAQAPPQKAESKVICSDRKSVLEQQQSHDLEERDLKSGTCDLLSKKVAEKPLRTQEDAPLGVAQNQQEMSRSKKQLVAGRDLQKPNAQSQMSWYEFSAKRRQIEEQQARISLELLECLEQSKRAKYQKLGVGSENAFTPNAKTKKTPHEVDLKALQSKASIRFKERSLSNQSLSGLGDSTEKRETIQQKECQAPFFGDKSRSSLRKSGLRKSQAKNKAMDKSLLESENSAKTHQCLVKQKSSMQMSRLKLCSSSKTINSNSQLSQVNSGIQPSRAGTTNNKVCTSGGLERFRKKCPDELKKRRLHAKIADKPSAQPREIKDKAIFKGSDQSSPQKEVPDTPISKLYQQQSKGSGLKGEFGRSHRKYKFTPTVDL